MLERVTRLSSYALLLESGRILLCRLSSSTSAPGAWTLPGGGVEFGESPEEAAIREVLEETGLTISGLQLLRLWSETEEFRGKECHLLRFIYSAEFDDQPLTVELNGSTDHCEWIQIQEVEKMQVVPLVQTALQLLT